MRGVTCEPNYSAAKPKPLCNIRIISLLKRLVLKLLTERRNGHIMPHPHVPPPAVAKVLPNDGRCRFNGHGLWLVTEVRRPRKYAGGEDVDVKVFHGSKYFD